MWDRLRSPAKESGDVFDAYYSQAPATRRGENWVGVHGDTGLYAYSIMTTNKTTKNKQRKPATVSNLSHALATQSSSHNVTMGLLTPRSSKNRPGRGPAAPPSQSRITQAGTTSYQQPSRAHDTLGVPHWAGRPASSIYSQPSPEAAVFAAHELRNNPRPHDPLEISPPSSPDITTSKSGYTRGDVSPIDETDDMSQIRSTNGIPPRDPTSRSNIPTMRRERRKNSDAAKNALRSQASQERLRSQRPHDHTVRWDPRTGEPTSEDKGRKSQVSPQAYASDLAARETAAPTGPPAPRRTPSAGMFGPRIQRKVPPPTRATPEPELAPPSRPAWQGGSGRSAIAEPLREDDYAPKLVSPPRNRNPPAAAPSSPAQGNGVLSPVHSMGSGRMTPPVASPVSPKNDHMDNFLKPDTRYPPQPSHYPSPPPDRAQAPPIKSPSTQAQPPPPLQERAVLQPDVRTTMNMSFTEKAIRRKPAGGRPGHQAHESWSSSVYSIPQTPVPMDPATPTRDSSDIRRPHAPNVSTVNSIAETDGPSILDRKRPTVPGYEGQGSRSSPVDNVVKINMGSPYYKDAPASKAVKGKGQAIYGGNNDSMSSLASDLKALPRAPPEESAQGRVAELNAMLQSLGNRRININTAIRQMTELMPTDNLLASTEVIRKREMEKRKVEALKLELAEVDRESYELGLKLHRAYKRLDRDAEYEPTTLWVRRVTG